MLWGVLSLIDAAVANPDSTTIYTGVRQRASRIKYGIDEIVGADRSPFRKLNLLAYGMKYRHRSRGGYQ